MVFLMMLAIVRSYYRLCWRASRGPVYGDKRVIPSHYRDTRARFTIENLGHTIFRAGIDLTRGGGQSKKPYADRKLRRQWKILAGENQVGISPVGGKLGLEDIFAVQDEVTRSIVSSLSDRLEAADAERAKHKATSNMSAYDYLLQGREHWHRLTREDISAARSMYRKAVDLDPQYARAHTLLAATHIWDKFMGWSVSSEGLHEARTFAEKALALDERDGSSHAMLGFVCFFDGRDDKAEAHFERALSLNPNDADVAAFWSDVLVYLGRTEEALSFISRARQLNPFPPDWYHWFFALVLFSARRYEDAIRAIDQIRILDRWHHAYRAGCFARLGRTEEAQSDVQAFVTVREKEPAALGKPLPVNQLDFVQERAGRYREEVDRDHFLDSLRIAGLLA